MNSIATSYSFGLFIDGEWQETEQTLNVWNK